MEESKAKGRISIQKTIWCGGCAEWDQRSGEPRLSRIWRKEGWVLTRAYGWLCPKCVASGLAHRSHNKKT